MPGAKSRHLLAPRRPPELTSCTRKPCLGAPRAASCSTSGRSTRWAASSTTRCPDAERFQCISTTTWRRATSQPQKSLMSTYLYSLLMCVCVYIKFLLFSCLFVYLHIFLCLILSVCLSIYLSLFLSIYLFVYLSIYLSIYLLPDYVWLSIYLLLECVCVKVVLCVCMCV